MSSSAEIKITISSGYLYVDGHVHEDVRAQAQGLLVVFTQAIGFFLNSQIFVNQVFTPLIAQDDSLATWKAFWMTPVWFLVVVLIGFAVLFRENKTVAEEPVSGSGHEDDRGPVASEMDPV